MRYLLLSLFCLSCTSLFAFEAGDTVFVIAKNGVSLKDPDGVVSTTDPGWDLTVQKFDGQRLLVQRNDEQGWINAQDVATADRAIQVFTEAIKSETTAEAHSVRGRIYEATGQTELAERDYSAAIRLLPKNALYYYQRGNLAFSQQNYDAAIADADKSMRVPSPYYDIALAMRGHCWLFKGEQDKAIADFDKLLQLYPERTDVLLSRSRAWYSKGEFDKAAADADGLIQANPKDVNAYMMRALIHRQKGEFAKHIADLTQVVRLDPEHAFALDYLAWLLATIPDEKLRDGKRAIEYARKAQEINGEKPGALVALAAAYAADGQFAEAIKWQKKAIEKTAGETPDLYREMLERFEAGKPYSPQP